MYRKGVFLCYRGARPHLSNQTSHPHTFYQTQFKNLASSAIGKITHALKSGEIRQLEAGQSFNFGALRHHGLDLTFTLRLGSDQKKEKREELGLGEGWFDNIEQAFNSFNLGYRYNY